MSHTPPIEQPKEQSEPLFRVSLKGLIINRSGQILVVKESGRDYWDLPGGGLDRGESIRGAIERELVEEVGYQGKFNYSVLLVEDPQRLATRAVWQIRVVARIEPEFFNFEVGHDADAVAFLDPILLQNSRIPSERQVSTYAVHSTRA